MKFAIRNPKCYSAKQRFAAKHESAIRNGFTLLELLIAMGILAVGGAMVAALFPAAIKENTSSYNDTLGSIICENGLATIKALAPTATTSLVFIEGPALGEADSVYPHPYLPKPTTVTPTNTDWVNVSGTGIVPKSTLGFLWLWRKDGEATRIIIVSYKKLVTPTDYTDTVEPVIISASITSGDDRFTIGTTLPNIPANDRSKLLGSFVVGATTGEYRKIIAVQGSQAIVDKPFSDNHTNVWVFLQSDGTNWVGTRSPVINLLSTRTTLRQ